MITKLSNSARDYAWGSLTLMPDYLGIAATGAPMAELWFGTHPGSLTRTDGGGTLLDLRGGEPLPYLLKVLAAGKPLSLQAHPNPEQAVEGYARENAAGLPIDSPERNYRDDHHKPEMLVALTEFEALGGFRPVPDVSALLKELENSSTGNLANLLASWRQLLLRSGMQALFSELIGSRGKLGDATGELAAVAGGLLEANADHPEAAHLRLVQQLETEYPGDPGIVISLLCNLIDLEPGQAVQIQAGQIHAYVRGLGVEIMASSDNVLRGGLTPKHIDVPELLRVLTFEPSFVGPFEPREVMTGLWEYPRQCDDFILYRLELTGARVLADLKLSDAGILICTAGELSISDSKEEHVVVSRGEAVYLADARFFTFAGSGTAFLATS